MQIVDYFQDKNYNKYLKSSMTQERLPILATINSLPTKNDLN